MDYSKLFNCTKNKDGGDDDINILDGTSSEFSKRKSETEAKNTEGNLPEQPKKGQARTKSK